MPVYFVTGKLGGGKSLVCVKKIQEYLREGRKVATNLDLHLDKLVSHRNKNSVIRLPDKPRVEDLDLIGLGHDEKKYNQNRNGILVLDELGTWFNSRNWNEKGRAEVIDFLLHIRKKRWDVFFIVQNVDLVDKQLRQSLCQMMAVCKDMSAVGVPFLNFFSRLIFDKQITLPAFHVAKIYDGASTTGYVLDRWTYKARDLYTAYETEQCFMNDEKLIDGQMVDMRASYCLLSAWHLKGRYLPSLKQRILNFFLKPVHNLYLFIDEKISVRPRAAGRGLTDICIAHEKIISEALPPLKFDIPIWVTEGND